MNIVTGTLVVGISENSFDSSSLQIFPNPFSGSFTIKTSKPGLIAGAMVHVFAVDGRLTQCDLITRDKEIEVQTEALQKGFYILEVSTPGGSWRRTLIKE
jgi:hypothetical protein